MDVAWKELQQYIEMEEPAEANLYLGCTPNFTEHRSENHLVRKVLYDMKDYLTTSISLDQKVCDAATGKEATLRNAATPFIEEDQALALAKAFVANWPCIECEWRGHTSPEDAQCTYE